MLLLQFFILHITFLSIHSQNQPPPANTTTTTTKPSTTTAKLPYSNKKPTRKNFPLTYNNGENNREILGDWLVGGCWSRTNIKSCSYHEPNEVEYEGYDGWYNNLARPDSGAIDRPLLRRWPASYEDGTYIPWVTDRPNPMNVSWKILSGEIGTKSKTGKNALLVFFGQQVVEEILDAQRPACPPEYFNIEIPSGAAGNYFQEKPGHKFMPLLRTRYDQRTGFSPNNPRQQLNEITPYIDGGLMYGITKQWSDQLRKYENGTLDPDGLLAYSHDGLFPEYNNDRLPLANPPPPTLHSEFVQRHEIANVKRFFKLGNPRGNENTFLLTFGILWFRWHNYIAKTLRRHHSSWSSEKVFNEARKWTIATQQHIIIDQWLPSWTDISKFPNYKGYDPSIDPQIDQFFQAAAFRFGHTLVVPGVYLRDYGRNNCSHYFPKWGKAAVRTCNSFWRPQDALKTKDEQNNLIDIDRVLMGMSLQLCEKEDHRIVEDLRGNVFGPLEFPRRDLMAINIQRGRDHGLPDFNSARRAFGLPTINNFDYFLKFTTNKTVIQSLKELYGSVDKLDVWVGGILETIDGPGELFETIILDQFRRIRDGDRFWYENQENGLFTKDEIRRIKQLDLYDIIMAVTKMDHDDIPPNPFRVLLSDQPLAATCKATLMESSCANSTPTTTKFACSHLPQLTASILNEDCVKEYSYDYFWNSELSYILSFSFIAAIIVGIFGAAYLLIRLNEKWNAMETIKHEQSFRNTISGDREGNIFTASEWVSFKCGHRPVVIVFKPATKQVKILTQKGQALRILDLSHHNRTVRIIRVTDNPYLVLKTNNEYDLVLKFESNFLKDNFYSSLEAFLKMTNISNSVSDNHSLNTVLKQVVTKDDRQKKLEMFFRVVFAQAFKINHSKDELLKVGEDAKEIANMELTLVEFADALNMSPQSEFATRMFNLIDKDKNGSVSFREFVDLLIIFAKGTEEEKAKLLFDMYDINATGYLTVPDFIEMMKSFLETVGGDVETQNLQKTVDHMIKSAGLKNKAHLEFRDFKKIVGHDISKLSKATLGFKGAPDNSFLNSARDAIENIYESPQDLKARIHGQTTNENPNYVDVIDREQEETMKVLIKNPGKVSAFIRYLEKKSLEIFWFTIYTLVLWAIFAERAYYYSVEREHSGLRRIAGYGVTVTRGAASAMMFTYSSLLVTMCRNIITYLRGTCCNKYFPFDSYVEFHKYIAYWALFFTLMHIIGHAFNFYHISTQTSDDLTCLFRNYFHATHEIPKFHYWCWQTMTGITGVILTIITAIIFIFAQPIVRRKLYNWFWYTHMLYPLFFIFMVLHGSGRLIQFVEDRKGLSKNGAFGFVIDYLLAIFVMQCVGWTQLDKDAPFFYYFFLVPVILYAINVIISASRKKVQIPVLKANILPSDVTMLEFKRPENFEYLSGQFVQIACLGLNPNEYHPFTLTSSPDEANLTVHIRSVGPWTRHIRKLYDDTIINDKPLPKIFLDGPFGEGHQDWYKYDVSVLVGGGIGVTPFASILKDIVFRANIKFKARCEKVYFIWVARSQKQFEWLVDIIRNLEAIDQNKVVSTHIFITQFYEKFDLRTILLYICERHYQKLSQKSLFTNLEAVTHFGRPNFAQFFKTLQGIHQNVNVVGVFSCGPPSMTSSIDNACVKLNKVTTQGPTFEHHFKNF